MVDKGLFPGYTSFTALQEAFGPHCDIARIEHYLEQASQNECLTKHEASELAFSLFCADVSRALEEIHGISAEHLSTKEFKKMSKEHHFWITGNGAILEDRPGFSGGAW